MQSPRAAARVTDAGRIFIHRRNLWPRSLRMPPTGAIWRILADYTREFAGLPLPAAWFVAYFSACNSKTKSPGLRSSSRPMREASRHRHVEHRTIHVRGVIFARHPVFWRNRVMAGRPIPAEVRPRRDSRSNHCCRERATTYSPMSRRQNLLPDETGKPLSHPQFRISSRVEGAVITYRAIAPLH